MIIDISTLLENIDIDKAILENIDIDIDKDILEKINIDKGFLENIDIDINKDILEEEEKNHQKREFFMFLCRSIDTDCQYIGILWNIDEISTLLLRISMYENIDNKIWQILISIKISILNKWKQKKYIDIDIDSDINIDIDKGIFQNIDIDKIFYYLGFDILSTPSHTSYLLQHLNI